MTSPLVSIRSQAADGISRGSGSFEGVVKVLHFIAEPRSWQFFYGQPEYLRAHGFEFHAASSPGPLLDRFGRTNGVAVHPVPVERRLSVFSDLVSVWRLLRVLREVRPDILHSHFSKPGVIGMVAGFLARIPIRIYHNHGMALSSARGWKRALLWSVEKLACLLAHRVVYVAPSVREDAARWHVCGAGKSQALLSANGLDYANRFTRRLYGPEYRDRGRKSLHIPDDAFVVGFVGRILKIKGIDELVGAWQLLAPTEPKLHLVVVGEFDSRDPISSWAEAILRTDSRIHLTRFVEEPAALYPVMDALVQPSYHEGLGYSMLEGAAMELPVVGTRIPGTVDAIRENVTGILVEPRNPEELASAIRIYMRDPALASAHGRAGREYVVQHFRRSAVWEGILRIYHQLLDERIAARHTLVDRRVRGAL
jgi:glycosyltransferase involved in cell wall biosynthesis